MASVSATNNHDANTECDPHLDVAKAYTVCLTVTRKSACPICGSYVGASLCPVTVCRLPVNGPSFPVLRIYIHWTRIGLSRSCLLCYHVVPICRACVTRGIPNCNGGYGNNTSIGLKRQATSLQTRHQSRQWPMLVWDDTRPSMCLILT